MAMRDTIRMYKVAVGKVVQQIESFQEHGELGVMGTTCRQVNGASRRP